MSGEWAKSRKGSDRKSNRTRQKNKRGDVEKWAQTDNPEIPDRGETSDFEVVSKSNRKQNGRAEQTFSKSRTRSIIETKMSIRFA